MVAFEANFKLPNEWNPVSIGGAARERDSDRG